MAPRFNSRFSSGPPEEAPAAARARFLAELDAHTAPAQICRVEGERVRCLACGHRCLLADGQRGVCRMRFHRQGELRVPFGYVAGLAADPVEKKPFFHVLPGSDALTFGMLGCNLHCPYCQNWSSSQVLRDADAWGAIQPVTAAQVAAAARRAGARLLISSYNEPLITSEWAGAVFEAAGDELVCAYVSNGFGTPEVIEWLQPRLQAIKIDLKTLNPASYRQLGATLEGVLETIRLAHARKLWVEVLTLLVPGFNDSEAELRGIARFVRSLGADVPWHVTAFHKDYRMTEPEAATAGDLIRAAEIGVGEGLRYVYAGNRSGQVGEWENTRCPQCRLTLVERTGFRVRANRLTACGACPGCGEKIPGIWG